MPIFFLDSTDIKDLTKFRNWQNKEIIDITFVKTMPSLFLCIKYLYNINIKSEIIINYITRNYSYKDILEVINYVGHLPLLEYIIKEYSFEDYNLIPPVSYFKVVKVLKNGTKVSPGFTKESGKRKVYMNGGESKVIDKGMVFDNIFSAIEYKKTNSDLIIVKCTGKNFKYDYSQNELPGSGYLEDIKISKE